MGALLAMIDVEEFSRETYWARIVLVDLGQHSGPVFHAALASGNLFCRKLACSALAYIKDFGSGGPTYIIKALEGVIKDEDEDPDVKAIAKKTCEGLIIFRRITGAK